MDPRQRTSESAHAPPVLSYRGENVDRRPCRRAAVVLQLWAGLAAATMLPCAACMALVSLGIFMRLREGNGGGIVLLLGILLVLLQVLLARWLWERLWSLLRCARRLSGGNFVPLHRHLRAARQLQVLTYIWAGLGCIGWSQAVAGAAIIAALCLVVGGFFTVTGLVLRKAQHAMRY